MAAVYYFRIDGAKDNDEFFGCMRSSASQVYAGVDFRVGTAGWIPDLVKFVVEEPPDTCSLTLIELEATEPAALISCRKYLPENSAAILAAFDDYLDRVIRQCRISADPREPDFLRLKTILADARQVSVMTAGALRSSATLLEELPLVDQPQLVRYPRAIQTKQTEPVYVLRGDLRLSANDAKALARCIMILDAVIRHRDHSNASFQAWRKDAQYQPLKRLLGETEGVHPALGILILGRQNSGLLLDFERVLTELVEIWSDARGSPLDREYTRRLVSGYFPVALPIRGHDQMTNVFETARKHMAGQAAEPLQGS